MPISSANLNTRLKNSKTLFELRKHARENLSILNAVHDSIICVSCGRFGTYDYRLLEECIYVYLLASETWLDRPKESFGSGAREKSNILHAGAKLSLHPCDYSMIRLLKEAVRMSDSFDAQNVGNSLWALATLAAEDADLINALSQACVDRVKEMNPQGAFNALWSIETLKVSNDRVITTLSQACVDRVREMNAHGVRRDISKAESLYN